MLTEAVRYLKMMPKLEWMYLGQLEMNLEKDASSNKKTVSAGSGRGYNKKMMEGIFGWEGLGSLTEIDT